MRGCFRRTTNEEKKGEREARANLDKGRVERMENTLNRNKRDLERNLTLYGFSRKKVEAENERKRVVQWRESVRNSVWKNAV